MNYSKSWDQLGPRDLYHIMTEIDYHHAFSSRFSSRDEAGRKAWEVHRREKRLFKETYADYLKSDAWQEKREAVFDRDRYRCRFCDAPATEVHHLTYDRKFNESLFDLVSTCSDCHEAVHILK